MMFVFWELVGVSSYLLIGFWYEKPSAGDAAKKAFLTNRLGDFGFLLGIIIVWAATGSVNFAELAHKLGANARRARVPGHDRRPAGLLRRDGQEPRSSRCTSGCRTRWKVPRRCPR
jgi:formate hydrogenlyase subunit 3/multisubunit Na+/H+ antiporter MnhD subunit